MGKSLTRVAKAIAELGLTSDITETGTAKTAAQAAAALNCQVDQIAKSIVLAGAESGTLFLFLTAGARQVDLDAASALAGEPLTKAQATVVRQVTGFAIGGVSPVGHLTPIRGEVDITVVTVDTIFAAAGTPNHVFDVTPDALQRATNAVKSDFVQKM
ncbi:MAG: YbaK/EbsC family protein [Pseudomonadota bacterium]